MRENIQSTACSECAFMQPHERSSSSTVLNGHHIEPPGRTASSALSKKPPGHALHVLLLLRRDGFLRSARILLGSAARLHLDERQHRAVISDQIDFALRFRRSVIACHKDVTMTSQIPISVRLAPYSCPPGFLLGGFLALRFRQTVARRESHEPENRSRDQRHSYFRTSSSNSTVFPRTTNDR
jgi:hypothetical protein